MKPALRYILPVTLLMVIFTSCSNKGPKEAALIPKTASAVIVLDPGAMQDKLTSGGISVDTLSVASSKMTPRMQKTEKRWTT